MKKILLLAAAALLMTTANAQLKRSETTRIPAMPTLQLAKPQAKMEVAEMRTAPVTPQRTALIDIAYRRPAGAFPASIVVEDGSYAGILYAPYIAVTPYVDYTFTGLAEGQLPESTYEWDVNFWDTEDDEAEEAIWETVPGMGETGMDLTWQWTYETADVPIFYVNEPDGGFHMFYLKGYKMSGTSDKPVIDEEYAQTILSVPSTMAIWDRDFLKSSKNFCYGGRNGDQRYPMTYYSGAKPYGTNESGWWFGKNGGTNNGGATIDGIAQAFEKPTCPYLLKEVVVDCAVLEVTAQVDMTCKIYKLDEIPAYGDTTEAVLPDEPGELIAQGRATLTPETANTTGDLIFFTLFGEEDGLEYDITPTIDCAILVVIDGYNDPEMANLKDFSAMVSSDMDVDEGFGELAYLKYGILDEEGNVDHYVWAGLNNFFTSGAMKTGLTIYLSTENPYLTYNYSAEDGEYTFPVEGGLMEKQFGDHVCQSIEFWSWTPSADDEWFMSCNDEEVPEWLTIELEDIPSASGAFSGLVNATVTAEALPEGVPYREAIVRFEIPGNYIDYKFMQGTKPEPQPFLKGDVNGDGEVNIADVNALIAIILGGEADADTLIRADVNEDGEINIADVNALMDIILNA